MGTKWHNILKMCLWRVDTLHTSACFVSKPFLIPFCPRKAQHPDLLAFARGWVSMLERSCPLQLISLLCACVWPLAGLAPGASGNGVLLPSP